MPHLTDLNGAPMDWATLWKRYEAYYAAREQVIDIGTARWASPCRMSNHRGCPGVRTADGSRHRNATRVRCECPHHEAVSA